MTYVIETNDEKLVAAFRAMARAADSTLRVWQKNAEEAQTAAASTSEEIEGGYYDDEEGVYYGDLDALVAEGDFVPLEECDWFIEMRKEFNSLPVEEQEKIRAEVRAECGYVDN